MRPQQEAFNQTFAHNSVGSRTDEDILMQSGISQSLLARTTANNTKQQQPDKIDEYESLSEVSAELSPLEALSS